MSNANHNRLQAACTGFEYTLGEMYALREFSFNPGKNGLTGVIYTNPWTEKYTANCERTRTVTRPAMELAVKSGEITIEQMSAALKRPKLSGSSYLEANGEYLQVYKLADPCTGLDPACTCGIYAYHSRAAHTDNSYGCARAPVVGVIKATGKTIVGTLGLRTEKAEIVALAPARGPRQLIESLEDEIDYCRSRIGSLKFGITTQDAMIDIYEKDVRRTPRLVRSKLFWDALFFILIFLGTMLALEMVENASSAGESVLGGLAATVGGLGSAMMMMFAGDAVRDRHKRNVEKLETHTQRRSNYEEQVKDMSRQLREARSDLADAQRVESAYKLSPIKMAFSDELQKAYPNVCYHASVDEMLAHHPLTGVEGLS